MKSSGRTTLGVCVLYRVIATEMVRRPPVAARWTAMAVRQVHARFR
ncbi:MAG: hypothetical protein U0269_29610 [Polyangiales bacterium]